MRKRTAENVYDTRLKNSALFYLLALPAFAADTAIVGKVVGEHDGGTL